MLTGHALRYYRALRRYWNEPARTALKLARARINVSNKVDFIWEHEQCSVEDVWGEASRYECENCGTVRYSKGHGACCDDPHVRFHDTGVYVDPTSEHLCCVARKRVADAEDESGDIMDSLGMIDGVSNPNDPRDYGFLVECQMSLEIQRQLDEELVRELMDCR